MGEEGSIEHLFKIMSRYSDSASLQVAACSALTNLSCDSGNFILVPTHTHTHTHTLTHSLTLSLSLLLNHICSHTLIVFVFEILCID
jgi:hypothetical protein